ncbi:unnamed protein product [Symbiodinium sp. CCMP2456]|nr:unnamed protein product [Symbiodinium sp. CCMP2456]
MSPGTRPADGSKSVQVTKLSNQISRHFKQFGLRKAEFKRQKSLLIEKELQAHFKAKHETERAEGDASERPASSPAASPSSKARGQSPSAQVYMPPASPGKVSTRFAASYPVWMHPCIHPGAASQRPASQGSRIRSTSGGSFPFGPSDGFQAAEIATHPLAMCMEVQQLHFCCLTTAACTKDLFLSADAEALRNVYLFLIARTKTKIRAKLYRIDEGHLETAETEEDRLFGTSNREEELFQAVEEEAAALKANWETGLKQDPPEMIERLGDLMALLGPRYRTLSREAVWEKALAGGMTAFERREKRLGTAAASALSGHTRSRGQSKGRPPSPERLQDYDPDGSARAAWLQARDREQDGKALGRRIKSVRGPSHTYLLLERDLPFRRLIADSNISNQRSTCEVGG